VAIIGFMLITTLLVIPVNVLGKNTSKKKVIIGFKDKPDRSLIKSLDGEVDKSFTTIKAVSARIPEHALDKVSKAPGVLFVEPDVKIYALGEVLPWGIDRIDAEIVHSYNKGSGVKVAVLDTGIDYDHPDLSQRFLGGYDFVNNDDDPMDDHGHGTHCAGIIAAVDNEIGVIGASPEAGLYALKVLDSGGSGDTSDLLAGIEWALKGEDGVEGTDDDADIISMSLGSSKLSKSLEKLCDSVYSKGILLVAAAGNSGSSSGADDTVSYPARFDSVVAVSAVGINDVRPSWSSTGPSVELSAPGISIYSTFWDNSYDTLSGTSMACPHVSGVAALVMVSPLAAEYDLDSDGVWDPEEVRRKMWSTAIDLGEVGRDNIFGYGLVNALQAVDPNVGEEPQLQDISISELNAPDSVTRGELVDVVVRVENLGNTDVGESFTVTLMDLSGQMIIGEDTLNSLPAGSSITLTYQWDTSQTHSSSYLKAKHNYVDYNDGNDWASKWVSVEEPSSQEPSLIDVSVTSVQAPVEIVQGDVIEVIVTVENIGEQDINEAILVSLLDETDSALIGEQSLLSLPTGSSSTVHLEWDTSSSSIGLHQLKAAHSLMDDEPVNDQASTQSEVLNPSVPQSPSLPKIHVGDIDGSAKVAGKSGKWSASFTVLVHDENCKPLPDVTVKAEWDDGVSYSVSVVTDRKGKAKFQTEQTTSQFISFKIIELSRGGYTYDASANHDIDGDSDGTSLIIIL
jgi:subtilisin family serine protease